MPIETSHPRDTLASSPATDAIRASLLQTYTRFGGRIAELASRSLRDPLTRRDAERLLRAAASLGEARRLAFVSAGFQIGALVRTKCGRVRMRQRWDRAVLDYCVDIINESAEDCADFEFVVNEAERLHDRVRAFLDKRGRWPVLGAREFEANAKPAILVLAAWRSSEVS
ncbi:hypothetical protein [Peristeroidobacter soli]|uniref:hypothetical protein n=1 Tax=Peristeroidobacter soli TaxID=2497877 RepID=UPI00101C6ED3|nr:hypothetical protein [Peristeroidobacter soli]